MKKPTTSEDDQPKPGKSRAIKLILFPVAALILIGAGVGGGYFLFGTQGDPLAQVERIIERRGAGNSETGTENSVPQKVAKGTDNSSFVTTYYEFSEPITTNLKESRRYLQVSLGLSTQYDKKVIDNVERHQLALRSDVIGIISGFTETDIEGKAGRDELADAIRDVMNARLEALERFGGIETVHFSSFILQ